ncbi:hypothetical protein VCJ71_12515 [Alteriqipengyuania sp. WL0013]|uniref:hypothetical protein n=1 Tax=Alteriqipengyuania sp. WL0013 TaxID=3110773 RepID=UPI002CB9379B|nr:hypothetical protein [Alteriqipengyuania sp. WL0013]MEB3416886.1 hypothetical protein [Alteriqipengyuania sp. WL0013]
MARRSKHITDRGARKLRDIGDDIGSDGPEVAGPSPNAATNLLIHDLVLRSVGRIARQTVEKGLLQRRYGRNFAKDAVENRSMLHALAAYGATKVATRSLPGAALVGGGLLAKTLWDRSRGRRSARRAGDKLLNKQAEE